MSCWERWDAACKFLQKVRGQISILMSYKQLSESVVSAKCDCCSVEEAMYSIVNSATRVVFAHGTLWVGQERGHGGIDCYSLPVSGCRHCLSCKTYYRSLGSKMCVPQINYYSVARSCADEMAVNVEHGPDTGFCFSSISLSPTFERDFLWGFLSVRNFPKLC